MGFKDELPVFTQTNLGTRIAIPVSPDITAGTFKGELQRAHISCFPELGFLSVDAVMVKRNSYFYHLPDLLPLKHVFQSIQDLWFLQVNASLSNNLPAINNSAKVRLNMADVKGNKHNISSENVLLEPALVATSYPPRKKKKRKRRRKVKKYPERFSCERLEPEPLGNVASVCVREGSGQQARQTVLRPCKVSHSNATPESPHGSLSGAVSVSSIIDKYLINFINIDHIGSDSSSEVATRTGQCDVDKMSFGKKSSTRKNPLKTRQRLQPSLLPEDFNPVALKNKYERSEVGKRLVVASNNLGSSQRSAMSKGKRLWDSDATSIVKNLTFEIDSND